MGDRASGAELQYTALAQSQHLAPPQLHWDTGFRGRSCHNFGSAMAPCWAQSICSVGVHISWHFTYRDDGCRSPKLPLSSGSSETKADTICQNSTSPMLVTASCLLPSKGYSICLLLLHQSLHCSPQKQPFFPPAQPLIIPARSHSPSQDGLLDVHWA